MRQLTTFKDVAAALREAEDMRLQGVIQETTDVWHDTGMSPMGVCAAGAISYVCGMTVGGTWTSYAFENIWPIWLKEVVHPVSGASCDLLSVLSELHDSQEWPWPQLASWLEGLEGEQA